MNLAVKSLELVSVSLPWIIPLMITIMLILKALRICWTITVLPAWKRRLLKFILRIKLLMAITVTLTVIRTSNHRPGEDTMVMQQEVVVALAVAVVLAVKVEVIAEKDEEKIGIAEVVVTVLSNVRMGTGMDIDQTQGDQGFAVPIAGAEAIAPLLIEVPHRVGTIAPIITVIDPA
jgi:hypothetical protein